MTCIDIALASTKYHVIGILDDFKPVGTDILGIHVIGRIDQINQFSANLDVLHGFVAIGDNWNRVRVAEKILALLPEFRFVSLIHPFAVIGHSSSIGENVMIGSHSTIAPTASLESFSFIHNNATLGVGAKLSRGASISMNSAIGGKTIIREFTAITLGVIVHDRLEIGAHCVIGSGSVVNRPIPDHSIAYGKPARIVRSRKTGEKYLL